MMTTAEERFQELKMTIEKINGYRAVSENIGTITTNDEIITEVKDFCTNQIKILNQ